METKICSRCLQEKNYSEFNKNKKSKDGYNAGCRSCCRKAGDEYYRKNKEKFLEKSKEYYNKNRKRICLMSKEHYLNNTEQHKQRNKRYMRERNRKDPIFKLKNKIRTSIWEAFKRKQEKKWSKTEKTEEILGCSMDKFITYIVEQFQPGMTLENHGEWHLDHIIPLATAETKEDVIRLNHYTNFQPLWAEDNQSKGGRIL